MASDVKGVRGGIGRPELTALTGGSAPRAATGHSAGAPPSDRVSITDIAGQIQSIVRALDKVPVVDLARVSTVRESLFNGTYEINPFRIADKLMRFERMLPDIVYGEPGFA